MAAGIENDGVGAKGLRAVAGGVSGREGGVGGEDGREWQEGGGGRAPEEEKGDEADGGKEGEGKGGEKEEEEEEPEAVVSATVSVRFCFVRWLFFLFFPFLPLWFFLSFSHSLVAFSCFVFIVDGEGQNRYVDPPHPVCVVTTYTPTRYRVKDFPEG